MRECELAIRYPPISPMKHREYFMPESDEVVINLHGFRGVQSQVSINLNGEDAARDELQPLLGTIPPSRSGQQARLRQGLHTSNDNTPAIVKLSGIRAAMMQE